MFEDMPIVSSIMAIVFFGIVFVITDSLVLNSEIYNGYVVDKRYQAESNKIGTGVGVSSSGKSAIVITSESEPEKFLIMVKTEDGKISTVKCSPELYYKKEIGDKIQFKANKGMFTGIVWSLRGVK